MKNWRLLNTWSQWSRGRKISSAVCLGIILLLLLVVLRVRLAYSGQIYSVADAPEAIYGVVLGAALDKNHTGPSLWLRDRLDTAIVLLQQRRIMGVVLTGDDGQWRSDEITAMVNYLQEKGVPEDLIFVDKGAYRTFDSCQHLRTQGYDRVNLITQNFHLPRALYLCNALGVRAAGVRADRQWYWGNVYQYGRDWAASVVAWLDVQGLRLVHKGPTD